MKNQIRSLLGIEMSIGQREFKPLLLLLGILLFILLAIPLLLSLAYYKLKYTLIESLKELKKHKNRDKYKGVKWV